MPTYAYACKSCGHAFDAVQSFSEPSLTECPECTGPLRKQYGSIGVTFNGSGFYRTDSRAASGSASSSNGSSGNGSSGSGSSGSDSGAASGAGGSAAASSTSGASAPAPAAS